MPSTSIAIFGVSIAAFIYCLVQYVKRKNKGEDSCEYYMSLLAKIAPFLILGLIGMIVSFSFDNEILDRVCFISMFVIAGIIYSAQPYIEKWLPSELLLERKLRHCYLALLKILEPFNKKLKMEIITQAHDYLERKSHTQLVGFSSDDHEKIYYKTLRSEGRHTTGWALCYIFALGKYHSSMLPYLNEMLDRYTFNEAVLPGIYLEVFKEDSYRLQEVYKKRMQQKEEFEQKQDI